MLFSIFATLDRWSLNPRDWLTQYLQSCAENGGKAPSDITPFLPWNILAKTTPAATAPDRQFLTDFPRGRLCRFLPTFTIRRARQTSVH